MAGVMLDGLQGWKDGWGLSDPSRHSDFGLGRVCPQYENLPHERAETEQEKELEREPVQENEQELEQEKNKEGLMKQKKW